jgi:succinate-semialdehyde dehydrogenase/glutarate-semialdehyde dehydrogenase
MVLKPAQQTPLSALELGAILDRAGLPGGVLNVVPTSGAAELTTPLIENSAVRKISFTGSTEVGRHLLRQASGNLLRASMELGGNAPLLVFEDANLARAVDGTMVAKLRNMGQSCTAANRIYVADAIADEFTSMLGERMRGLKLGRGTEPGIDVGPLIDARQRERVQRLVDDAVRQGARIAATVDDVPTRGHFAAPLMVCDVPPTSALIREEIFGPVAPLVRFGDEAEAIRLANATEHGLVGFVFTENLNRAVRVAEAIETGMVGLNRGVVSNPAAPFGGVKHSGLGHEGGPEGIDEYLALKYVAVDV